MQGKNILIVGASSGIGASLAEMLISQGANVFSASRNTPQSAVNQHFNFDALEPDTSFVAQLPEQIHGVVYAPGSINLKPFHRLTAQDFLTDFRINVLGGIAILQALLPNLKKSGGASVVLFSTVAVQTGMGFHASVSASKGAVEGLGKSLAAEWASSKIRVNVIAPSLTDTPLAKNLLSSPEKMEASAKRHPLGRVGTSNDIASASAFLLSDNASWITGQVLGINGGLGSLT